MGWFRDRHRDIRNKGSFKINVLFHSDVMLPASSHSPYPFTWPFQDSMEHAVIFNCPCLMLLRPLLLMKHCRSATAFMASVEHVFIVSMG